MRNGLRGNSSIMNFFRIKLKSIKFEKFRNDDFI